MIGYCIAPVWNYERQKCTNLDSNTSKKPLNTKQINYNSKYNSLKRINACNRHTIIYNIQKPLYSEYLCPIRLHQGISYSKNSLFKKTIIMIDTKYLFLLNMEWFLLFKRISTSLPTLLKD